MKIKTFIFIKKLRHSPDRCGSVGWASSHKAKGCHFDSGSGHMPRLWMQSPVGVPTRGKLSMFLSHTDASLPLFFLPPFPSL